MVTHDLQVASRADSVIHLQDGRICRVESRNMPVMSAGSEDLEI